MAVCATCSKENREGARFCDSCGSALAAAAPVREVRKTVTILFCDVTGSTALGERLDPETLRHVMARYFETAKAVVERHGGTVEKFIGDAVMAVFGVPAVHEDDALRAVRAAEELRETLAGLNEELADAYGTRLELRTGVNTGEVVTGTEERLATGDAVNVAARLEQAAQPGEVLLGDETLRLVRDAVDVEPVEPLELKGKAEPVRAFRLIAVRPDGSAIARRHGAPMVGRERQRKLLEDAFANVVHERSCHLFTVLGTAGVGKSRLVAEFLNGTEGATVLRGRCLSYGQGISYWPVTEVVKQLVGEAPDAQLAELGLDAGSAAPLASILGDQDASASAEEIAWAVRKLLEATAVARPLVVVFEDVHWGEATFLDLVEHVADLSRDAPILLLCMARPELFDRRPAWGGGKLNATNVLLEPLAAAETEELVSRLLPAGGIDQGLRARMLEAAGGNPLFVEEMVAMLAERGGENGADGGDVSVPPTIQALLASRLDQLEPAERGVLERGSVEGQVFHRGALVALAPEEPQVDGRLTTLVRMDLVRPERAIIGGDEAFRFRHLLIRDAAYEALPKATRAELHDRFAAWLAEHGGDLVELDEIVGYHLEQSYRYRCELGPLDDGARALAPRAGERLVAAGRRARDRGDLTAAEALLARGVALLPAESASRPAALLDHALVLPEVGEFERAESLFDEVAAAARGAGDERLQAHVTLGRVELRTRIDREATMASSLQQAEEAAAALERLGDHEGVAWGLRLVANFLAWQGKTAESERILERALGYAERAGRPQVVAEILSWLALEAWWGPAHADDGVRRCEELMARAAGSPKVEATALMVRGSLNAMQGDVAAGRAEVAAGRAMLHDLGQRVTWAGTTMIEGEVELLAGDAPAAEAVLRTGYELLHRWAETGYAASILGALAAAVLEQGRDQEALRLCEETLQAAAADDFDPLVRQGCVRAIVLARLGDREGAERAIRQAIAIVEPTDVLPLRAVAALSLAEVERLAGHAEAERSALEEALRLAELKGDVLTARATRGRLAAFGRAGTARG